MGGDAAFTSPGVAVQLLHHDVEKEQQSQGELGNRICQRRAPGEERAVLVRGARPQPVPALPATRRAPRGPPPREHPRCGSQRGHPAPRPPRSHVRPPCPLSPDSRHPKVQRIEKQVVGECVDQVGYDSSHNLGQDDALKGEAALGTRGQGRRLPPQPAPHAPTALPGPPVSPAMWGFWGTKRDAWAQELAARRDHTAGWVPSPSSSTNAEGRDPMTWGVGGPRLGLPHLGRRLKS